MFVCVHDQGDAGFRPSHPILTLSSLVVSKVALASDMGSRTSKRPQARRALTGTGGARSTLSWVLTLRARCSLSFVASELFGGIVIYAVRPHVGDIG